MKPLEIKKHILFEKLFSSKELGYSINEIVIVVSVIGVLASLLVPSFRPAIEFVEVLIAEKYLYKAVRECQIGLIQNEPNPEYSLHEKDINLGIFKDKKFIFSHTGISGECSPEFGGNYLRASRVNSNNGNFIYSLIINVKTGEKTSEGKLPGWLDWWESNSPNLVPEEDLLLN